jgi:putative transposase
MPENRRKPLRLDPEVYKIKGQAFSVTVGLLSRDPLFRDQDLGRACIQILRELRAKHGNPVYAYCLMPDHVHLLVGIGEGVPLTEFVGSWKSLCYQARCDLGNRDKFWQRGFFDRALRGDEDLRATALYILNNPVRKGLVRDFREYPLSGSLEWGL